MKRALLVTGMVALMSGAAGAQGIPVFDTTSVAKSIEQIGNQLKQLEEMKAQLEEAKKLYGSMNKLTDIGNVAGELKSDRIVEALPSDFSELQGSLDGVLKGHFDGFSAKYDHFDTSGLSNADSFYLQELRRQKDETYTDMSVGQTIYEAAAERIEALAELRDKVGTVETAKEVADLQARVAAESALIQNQLLQMQGLAMVQRSREKVDEQRRIEARAQFNAEFREAIGQ